MNTTAARPSADTTGTVTLHFDRDGTVATLTLDRPAKLNAITLGMLDLLETHLRMLEGSDAHVVLIRSAGTKAFCVGADITQFARLSPALMWRRWITDGHRTFATLSRLRQPTIAVIDGIAVGGGLELALACDLRVGTTKARFGLPEAGLGTIPGWGGTERLTRTVGAARAKQLVFTRRQIDAATAELWGLLNAATEPQQLEEVLTNLVDDILGSAPTAVQVSKQLIAAADGGATSTALEALGSGFTAGTADFAAGVEAFFNKSTPKFTTS
jgi:enoyl-CoA hydratase